MARNEGELTEADINTIERNHALGKVRMDVFEKISGELYEERNKILREVEKVNQKISNPKELINFVTKIAANLSSVWESCDYHEKQSFQNMIFPEGLGFDSKIDDYRPGKINPVFAYYPELVRYYRKNESGSFNFDIENSRLVPGTGLEPVRLLRSQDFKCRKERHNQGKISTKSSKSWQRRDKTRHFQRIIHSTLTIASRA